MKKIILVLLLVFPLMATNWYVNVNADSNSAMDGRSMRTAYRNWAELSYREDISAGDVIFVAPGVYDMTAMWPIKNWSLWSSVASDNGIYTTFIDYVPVKIVATGPGVVIKSSAESHNYFCYFTYSNDNLTIRGINFQGILGNGTNPFKGMTNLKVYNCSFSKNGNDEIFNSADNISIYNCSFNDIYYETFKFAKNTTANHCIFGGHGGYNLTSHVDSNAMIVFKNCIIMDYNISDNDNHSNFEFYNTIAYNVPDSTTNFKGASVFVGSFISDPKVVWDADNFRFNYLDSSPAINAGTDFLDIGTIDRNGIEFIGE